MPSSRASIFDDLQTKPKQTLGERVGAAFVEPMEQTAWGSGLLQAAGFPGSKLPDLDTPGKVAKHTPWDLLSSIGIPGNVLARILSSPIEQAGASPGLSQTMTALFAPGVVAYPIRQAGGAIGTLSKAPIQTAYKWVVETLKQAKQGKYQLEANKLNKMIQEHGSNPTMTAQEVDRYLSSFKPEARKEILNRWFELAQQKSGNLDAGGDIAGGLTNVMPTTGIIKKLDRPLVNIADEASTKMPQWPVGGKQSNPGWANPKYTPIDALDSTSYGKALAKAEFFHGTADNRMETLTVALAKLPPSKLKQPRHLVAERIHFINLMDQSGKLDELAGDAAPRLREFARKNMTKEIMDEALEKSRQLGRAEAVDMIDKQRPLSDEVSATAARLRNLVAEKMK